MKQSSPLIGIVFYALMPLLYNWVLQNITTEDSIEIRIPTLVLTNTKIYIRLHKSHENIPLTIS